MKEYLETDVLIVGCGIAGSTAAFVLAEAGVNTIMISKGEDFTHANTNWAQGGIASLNEKEEPKVFINDIMTGGDQINNRTAVEHLVMKSRPLVDRILIDKLKIPFSTKIECKNGKVPVLTEPGMGIVYDDGFMGKGEVVLEVKSS